MPLSGPFVPLPNIVHRGNVRRFANIPSDLFRHSAEVACPQLPAIINVQRAGCPFRHRLGRARLLRRRACSSLRVFIARGRPRNCIEPGAAYFLRTPVDWPTTVSVRSLRHDVPVIRDKLAEMSSTTGRPERFRRTVFEQKNETPPGGGGRRKYDGTVAAVAAVRR